ncbi:hypothetical protein EHS25_000246 [Saitozyma podzolica]|uniref:SH3 domain-containing protein n=1 Tax=Saitozyma podzolica TaxID=1890683 RepID=A0A427YVK7_9TREE|nr:hypothetical protein EHS25_000246 [Saitozyma podzolica]
MGLNSPLPVRLQDETRKAAKIMRSFVDSKNNGLDKVIPRSVLERAHGFAIFTVFKAGFLFSARAGSGVVIARTQDGSIMEMGRITRTDMCVSMVAPSAIGLGGFGFGGQAGAEVTDFLIVLNSRAAVTSFMSAGSLTLGGNMSIAVGPLGRNAEGSGSVNTKGRMAAMYSYSKTKGLFGGVSVEGSVIVERQDANRLAYGGNPSAKQVLSGSFDPPDWAHVLIDEIEKCTGMPGGQRWVSGDEDGEGGGMGWNSPRGNRRASSFNPFSSSGTNSPKRTGPTSSSESYNAGLTWDSSGPMTYGSRSRASSNAKPWDPQLNPFPEPFPDVKAAGSGDGGTRSRASSNAKNWDDPLDSFSGPSSSARKTLGSGNASGFGNGSANGNGHGHGNGNGHDRAGGDDDLLGRWDADGKGLTASFNRLSTKNGGVSGNRSRSNSKPTPFNDVPEDEYVPYETHSSFATADWHSPPTKSSPSKLSKANGRGERPFSSYVPVESSPFADPGLPRSTSVGGRAFEDYIQPSTPPSNRSSSPRPNLQLKAGLEGGPDGYARAVGLYDFNATAEGDLGFKSGQVVVVVDKVGKGDWWRGRGMDGKEGIFPSNYVEVLELPKQLRGGLTRTELKERMASSMFD